MSLGIGAMFVFYFQTVIYENDCPFCINNGTMVFMQLLISSLFILDVDECQVHNGGCQQRCINTPGSYHCECKAGFRLHADSRSCIRK